MSPKPKKVPDNNHRQSQPHRLTGTNSDSSTPTSGLGKTTEFNLVYELSVVVVVSELLVYLQLHCDLLLARKETPG
jgi:hypothetical protein